MNKYKNAHLWLLIPFVVVMLGFLPSFWMKFTEVPWRQHLHGLTATAWFVLLIAQPYLITRGRAAEHRRYGMVALILAGGVIASGLNVIPYNLINERLPEVARYGLSFGDLILISGFTIAVAMAIRNSKSMDDHAKWMISTVFWAVAPGLFRLLFIPLVILDVPDFRALSPHLLAICGAVNIVVLGILMLRDKRAHPAYVLAAVGSTVLFVLMPVGTMQWWRTVADSLFTL